MYWYERIILECELYPKIEMVQSFVKNGSTITYTRGEVLFLVNYVRSILRESKQKLGKEQLRIGLFTSNSIEWIVSDLAILMENDTEIPVPLAFSRDQAMHLLSNIDFCIVDDKGYKILQAWSSEDRNNFDSLIINCNEYLSNKENYFIETSSILDKSSTYNGKDEICKIIHTSGTTSNPKGVMIKKQAINDLLFSMILHIEPNTYNRYLSLVPLSLLIEQVAGVYITFLYGGIIIFLDKDFPLLGEKGGNIETIYPFLKLSKPTALTSPPGLVEYILKKCRENKNAPTFTKNPSDFLFGTKYVPMIACGGAPISEDILNELLTYDIHVYEGYGLSENSSVVCWNTKKSYKQGTVGRPLGHVAIKLSNENELLIKSSSLFAGYANQDPSSCEVDKDGWLHSGDIASIDMNGFVKIIGRKKNVMITSNGRNISPEWVESMYKTLDCVEQAVIFGDNLEKLIGFIVVPNIYSLDEALNSIKEFGIKLSEIERIEEVCILHSNEDIYKEFFTVTNRPKRNVIWEFIHNQKIHSLGVSHV